MLDAFGGYVWIWIAVAISMVPFPWLCVHVYTATRVGFEEERACSGPVPETS
jgi:heme exporter protein D